MKIYISLLCFLLLFFSCSEDKDEPTINSTGSIFVTVTSNYQYVSGAEVTTELSTEATEAVTTDITGSAIISKIPIGGYKINAVHPEIGSGSAAATVYENEAAVVTVNLIAGVFEKASIDIQSPYEYSVHNLGDSIDFYALLSDEKDDPSTLDLEWSSDIDGIINVDPAYSNGYTFFSTNKLTEGEHVITLQVIDSDDYISADSIRISVRKLPDPVTLNTIEITTSGLALNWSVSTESEFSNYRILRSSYQSGYYEVINVINDINEVSFTDTNVSFSGEYYYQVMVRLNNGDEITSNTESQTFEGLNISVGTNIERMIVDPVRPYIYALDQINNSLLFINTDSRLVEKTIYVGSSPSDIDITLDNTKAYVANYGSTQIAVIDLASQTKSGDIYVNSENGTWGGKPYRLVCLADNKIAYTSEDQWNNVILIDATTGSAYSTSGSIYQPGLLANSDGTIVFATESGSTGSATLRYNLSGNTLSEVDESDNGSAFGSRDGCISGDDKYIFHRRTKYLANNLASEIGTFTEDIIACNQDGSIAIGEENIWNSETFSIIKPLPIATSILRLDGDDNTIYMYDSSSSKIYITTIK